MLKLLRKNTKIVIWGVVLSFVMWGGFSVSTSFEKRGRVAGEVFGKDISFQKFNGFYRAAQIFSYNEGESPSDPDVIRRLAWQSLAFSEEAKKEGIDVSDDEVRNELKRILASQGLENVTPELYERWLDRTVRQSANDFESQLREYLRIQKLIQKVMAGHESKPDVGEALKLYRLENTRLETRIVQLPTRADAETFLRDVPDTAALDQKLAADQTLSAETEDLTAREFGLKWKLMPDAVLSLLEQKPGIVPQPVGSLSSDFLVVDIKKISEPDETKFHEELKDEYLQRLESGEKEIFFRQWSFDLLSRAEIRDFTQPADEEENES